ncbi:MAG TPA: hypothetical protein VNT75_10685, partial [Symbiobacteriaceae bacterium]|nr:hypothetical protein [Symbiobacteriaceae bacterium]
MLFVAGFLLVVFTVAAYNAVATAVEQRRFGPPGRVIDGLHMISAGAADGPVVVIETGRGHPAVLWRPVIDLVAKFARVCVYDRPGYG